MSYTSLEITENEYLIKFNRSKFDLSFIRNLLTIVEISNPSEDHSIWDKDFSNGPLAANPEYYSHLDEK